MQMVYLTLTHLQVILRKVQFNFKEILILKKLVQTLLLLINIIDNIFTDIILIREDMCNIKLMFQLYIIIKNTIVVTLLWK